MKGLALSAKEQSRLQVLNAVIAGQWSMAEAAQVMGVSVRHGWRLIAAYRKDGAASLAHKNRGRKPSNATPVETQRKVASLAQQKYKRINHTLLNGAVGQTRRSGVVSANSETHPGEDWTTQSKTSSSSSAKNSQVADASSGNDVSIGRQL